MHTHTHSATHFGLSCSAYIIRAQSWKMWPQTCLCALHQPLLCSIHNDPDPHTGWLLDFLSLFITQPLSSFPLCTFLTLSSAFLWRALSLWGWKPHSTNGCTFSRALCHQMIPLSLFLEMGSRAAETGRSTALKASANLRKHKAGFFRVLFFHSTFLGHSTGGLWLCLQSWELHPGVWHNGVTSWAPKPPAAAAACN